MTQEQGFPIHGPADYQLAWLREELMCCLMHLGGKLARSDRAAEVVACLTRVDDLEQRAARVISGGLLRAKAANENTRSWKLH